MLNWVYDLVQSLETGRSDCTSNYVLNLIHLLEQDSQLEDGRPWEREMPYPT